MGREERKKAQEAFKHDPEVKVLLATDAAGEGINLQRAHLMVNYDLPWNPNRLEQRFGRIHRIGQTEVCHLWNLVADETREGDVYRRLLEKLEQARKALGGQVFDVLGKLQFEGRPLARPADRGDPLRRAPGRAGAADKAVQGAFDQGELQDLLEDKALAQDSMDSSGVQRVREEMERAEARRLQPHYIESSSWRPSSASAARQTARTRRYEVKHVPGPGPQSRPPDRHRRAGAAALRAHRLREGAGRATGPADGRLRLPGPPPARRNDRPHARAPSRSAEAWDRAGRRARPRHAAAGALLPRARDPGRQPTPTGDRRVISKRMLYVELDATGNTRHLHYAPYLDYRAAA
jgi:superfamily II DNA/RNA helicase